MTLEIEWKSHLTSKDEAFVHGIEPILTGLQNALGSDRTSNDSSEKKL
jgi:hypothetical protein